MDDDASRIGRTPSELNSSKRQIRACLSPHLFRAIAHKATQENRSRGDVLIEYAIKGGIEKLAAEVPEL